MPYFAYIVSGWVQKEGKMCLCNKSMAPNKNKASDQYRFELMYKLPTIEC